MSEVAEAKKHLEALLSEELKKQYYDLWKRWCSFINPLTFMEFDAAARRICSSFDQVHAHNVFLRLIMKKVINPKAKTQRNTTDKGSFEIVDCAPLSPVVAMPPDFENRSAAAELFLPDSFFITTRISVHAWENNLEGADDSVAEYLVNAAQIFVKNILTAMISRKEGYKIRDRKFQYAFGVPVPDPFIRNSNNIVDNTQDAKLEVVDEDDSFLPAVRSTVERAELENAFSYACSRKNISDNKLTVKLLYDTLKENANIVGLHSVHSLNLVRMGLCLDDS